MTRIITNFNEKGGVGKTCSTLNIGAALSILGKKVLLIDLDPSRKLTKYCGINPETLEKSTYHVAIGYVKPEDIVIQLPKIDLLPATKDLEAAIEDFVLMRERHGRMGELLFREQTKDFFMNYDYVIFDTMPTHSKLTDAALIASTEVFMVVLPEYFSVDSLADLLQTVQDIQSAHNPTLQITGAYIARKHGGFGSHLNLDSHVKESLGKLLFNTKIRTCESVNNSTGHHRDIFEYDKKSRGAKDYMALAKEIVQQEGKYE